MKETTPEVIESTCGTMRPQGMQKKGDHLSRGTADAAVYIVSLQKLIRYVVMEMEWRKVWMGF